MKFQNDTYNEYVPGESGSQFLGSFAKGFAPFGALMAAGAVARYAGTRAAATAIKAGKLTNPMSRNFLTRGFVPHRSMMGLGMRASKSHVAELTKQFASGGPGKFGWMGRMLGFHKMFGGPTKAFTGVAGRVMGSTIARGALGLAGGAITGTLFAAGIPYMIGSMALEAGVALRDQATIGFAQMTNRSPINWNSGFWDTQRTMTYRQRAIQAIQGSRLNARSAIGSEAALYHQ